MQVYIMIGKAESGKNTVSTMIKEVLEQRGKKVIEFAYADKVKYVAQKYLQWDGVKDSKGRELLQKLGTDCGRQLCRNLWVNDLMSTISLINKYEELDYAIITDARFPNEVNIPIYDFGDSNVKTIKVVRMHHKSLLTEEQLSHPSETSLDSFVCDKVFYNNGTLEELKEKVEAFLNE